MPEIGANGRRISKQPRPTMIAACWGSSYGDKTPAAAHSSSAAKSRLPRRIRKVDDYE